MTCCVYLPAVLARGLLNSQGGEGGVGLLVRECLVVIFTGIVPSASIAGLHGSPAYIHDKDTMDKAG